MRKSKALQTRDYSGSPGIILSSTIATSGKPVTGVITPISWLSAKKVPGDLEKDLFPAYFPAFFHETV
jgi:hypothetical protein